MKEFEFTATVGVSIFTKVRAKTLQEAKKILEDREDHFERIRSKEDYYRYGHAWGYGDFDGVARNIELIEEKDITGNET